MNEQLLCINTIGCTPNCTGLYNFIGLYHCTGHYPSLYTPLPLYRPAPLYKPVPLYSPIPPTHLSTGLYPCPGLYPSLHVHAFTPVQACTHCTVLYTPPPPPPASTGLYPCPLREQWYRPVPLPVPFHRIVLLYMYSSCLYSKHGFITGPLL